MGRKKKVSTWCIIDGHDEGVGERGFHMCSLEAQHKMMIVGIEWTYWEG